MTKHIALVTGAPLCRNPRVVKEADALTDAGYRVTVLRPVLSRALSDLDTDLANGAPWSVKTSVDLVSGRVRPMWSRFLRRAGVEAVRRGLELPEALGYGMRQTLRLARRIDADLTIGHQEVGLWVVNRLADEGRRVGADLEDWYSQDLLPEARRSRPLGLLRREEAAAVRRGGHVTTTSAALARRLGEVYSAPRPTVVYNAFSAADRLHLDGEVRDRRQGHLNRLSLHWVSQTVGPGRGLDCLLDALSSVETPVELHLRGICTAETEAALRSRLCSEKGHALFIHDIVSPGDLLSRIAEHDIGLALEPTEPPNKLYTVSNKMLHYLLGGLAVIATDTAGQREIAAAAPEAVHLCRPGDPSSLAHAINRFLAAPDSLSAAKQAAVKAAHSEFSWERQAPVFLASVERALQGNTEVVCPAS